MVDFKKIIAESIVKVLNIETNEIEMSIEKPKGADNGDYAFPCFKLAKTLRKAPPVIAEEIKSQMENDFYENFLLNLKQEHNNNK